MENDFNKMKRLRAAILGIIRTRTIEGNHTTWAFIVSNSPLNITREEARDILEELLKEKLTTLDHAGYLAVDNSAA